LKRLFAQHEALYFIADDHSRNSVRDAGERRRFRLAVALGGPHSASLRR